MVKYGQFHLGSRVEWVVMEDASDDSDSNRRNSD